MEISYWQSRWQKENTGWHMEEVYPPLPKYWPELRLGKGATVLVPLCGKSLDLLWLEKQAFNVTGVEVSEKAVLQFFLEHQIPYKKISKVAFTIYRSETLAVWVGDFLKLNPGHLPAIDAIYDKAALIALPQEQRKKYAEKILNFCRSETQILLNTFEYEQHEMNGPPFAVFQKELQELYGQKFYIDLLHKESILHKLTKLQARGISSYLVEKLYHLKPN